MTLSTVGSDPLRVIRWFQLAMASRSITARRTCARSASRPPSEPRVAWVQGGKRQVGEGPVRNASIPPLLAWPPPSPTPPPEELPERPDAAQAAADEDAIALNCRASRRACRLSFEILKSLQAAQSASYPGRRGRRRRPRADPAKKIASSEAASPASLTCRGRHHRHRRS